MARRCGSKGVIMFMCALVALGALKWSLEPEGLDIDANGSYTLGLRVPMPPMFRALNVAMPKLPRKLLQWMLPLDFESVKQRAKAMTGGLDSEDYGEFLDMESFRAMLENMDARANFIGRVNCWMRAPNILGFHLRLAQTLHDHPEVLNQTIEQPTFIAGYIRSGSTWLQHILVETYGASIRYVPYWESLGGGLDLDPQRPGSLKAMGEFSMKSMRNFPSLFAMHEVHEINQPEEEHGWTDMTCRAFLTMMINDQPGLDLLAVQPSSALMRYRLLKVIMQVKQWHEGPQRWVLKSPEHLNGVRELANVFPDARVVTIHRDEVAVYKSLLYIVHSSRSVSYNDPDPEVTKVASDIQLCSQRHGIQTISTLDVASLQLHFGDVISKPIVTLKQVASFAGLEWNSEIEARAEAAVEAATLRKKRMGGKIVYQLDAFGLTEDRVQERLNHCDKYESFEDSSTAKAPGMAAVCTACTAGLSNVTEDSRGSSSPIKLTSTENVSACTICAAGVSNGTEESKVLRLTLPTNLTSMNNFSGLIFASGVQSRIRSAI